RPGMKLQGVVTNVANFGAFVDVGVHQDGLVHVSQLADRFVKDPRDVVKAGQVVSVTVLEVDAARKRIALSMKGGAQPERAPRGAAPGAGNRQRGRGDGKRGATDDRSGRAGERAAQPTALGDALSRALKRS
ncbi:MAG: S1 RNA-binding domain-containing protein, partial [Burkholderiaceae bacterium]|nr:S1 RNA-binding domain-containing protein [Burkholderiaceae bacterium]